MTSFCRLDGGSAVANAMFSSESACFGIEGLRCVHAVSLPIPVSVIGEKGFEIGCCHDGN